MDPLHGFQRLHRTYDALFKENLRKGRMPMRSTKHGFWGAASLFTLYDFFSKVQLGNYSHFLDLGSGDGRVVLLASLFTKASGIECDEELVSHSEKVRDGLGFDAEFHAGNFMNHDLSAYDFIFINPDKGFSREFEDKIAKEAKGHLFVYNKVYEPSFEKASTYWFDELPIIRYSPDDTRL